MRRAKASAPTPSSIRGLPRGLLLGAAVNLLVGLPVGCGDGTTGPAPPSVTVELDFTSSTHGWEAGFSDYPVGDEENMELEAGHRSLPPELEPEGRGLFVGATNRSDDVFMFWTGRAVDLAAAARYWVTFAVTADEDGAVWLLVETDSGFEGRTELYYTRYRADLEPL